MTLSLSGNLEFTIRNPCFLWCFKKRENMSKKTWTMSTWTSPKIGSTETCKNMQKFAVNGENVYIDKRYETCVPAHRTGAMWRPRQGHVNAVFHGQCHEEMFFIGNPRNVAVDGSRQKLMSPRWFPTWHYVSTGVATCHLRWQPCHHTWIVCWHLTWHAMSSVLRAFWGWDVPCNTWMFPWTFLEV